MFEWGPDLRRNIMGLQELRSRQGLHSESKLDIKVADADCYLAVIDDK